MKRAQAMLLRVLLLVWPLASAADSEKKQRVVFVKTYKTGSTTVSEFLSAIAHREGMYALHPWSSGNFREGELSKRAANGEIYDIMYRHPTPHLDEASLTNLVPNALWVTIVREPVSRFLSAYNFVKRISKQYSPSKLVDAARRGVLPESDVNTFCNNFAWVLSGESASLAFYNSSHTNIFAPIRDKLDSKYLVLVQDDMVNSLALLAYATRFDATGLGGGRARASKAPGMACGFDCRREILSCNMLDQALYDVFKAKFLKIVAAIPSLPHMMADLYSPKSRNAAAQQLARYPINCQILDTGRTFRQRWKVLNNCKGRTSAAQPPSSSASFIHGTAALRSEGQRNPSNTRRRRAIVDPRRT